MEVQEGPTLLAPAFTFSHTLKEKGSYCVHPQPQTERKRFVTGIICSLHQRVKRQPTIEFVDEMIKIIDAND